MNFVSYNSLSKHVTELNYIIPNRISCSHTNPLRNWSVLFQFFGQFSLNDESLVGRLKTTKY